MRLRCPSCTGAVDPARPEACPTCGHRILDEGGVLDFMLGVTLPVEDDYDWDHTSDPRISPFTVTRWELLAERTAAWVGSGGPGIAVVGGAGENRVAGLLGHATGPYLVIDPSLRTAADARHPAGVAGLAVRAPGERLPLDDASVSVVELSGVLDHLTDPAAAVAEAARATVPGGLAVVTLTNDGSWYRRLARRFGVDSDDEHAHAHRFDVAAVVELLAPHYDVEAVETLAYVRLPAGVERRLARVVSDRWRRRLVEATDRVGRALGRRSGGMLLVVGRRRG